MNNTERNPQLPSVWREIGELGRLGAQNLAPHLAEAAAYLCNGVKPPEHDTPLTESEITRLTGKFEEEDRKRTQPITLAETAMLGIELDNADEMERRRAATLNLPTPAGVAVVAEALARIDNARGENSL